MGELDIALIQEHWVYKGNILDLAKWFGFGNPKNIHNRPVKY